MLAAAPSAGLTICRFLSEEDADNLSLLSRGISATASAARAHHLSPLQQALIEGHKALPTASQLACDIDAELAPLLATAASASSTDAVAATQALILAAVRRLTAGALPSHEDCLKELPFFHPSVIAPFCGVGGKKSLAVVLGRTAKAGEMINLDEAGGGWTAKAVQALRGAATAAGASAVLFDLSCGYSKIVIRLWHGGYITIRVRADERNAAVSFMGLLLAVAGARGVPVCHMSHMLGLDYKLPLKFKLLSRQVKAALASASTMFVPLGDGHVLGEQHFSGGGLAKGKEKALALPRTLLAIATSLDKDAEILELAAAARAAVPGEGIEAIVHAVMGDEGCACLLGGMAPAGIDEGIKAAVAAHLLREVPSAAAFVALLESAATEYVVPAPGPGAGRPSTLFAGVMPTTFKHYPNVAEFLVDAGAGAPLAAPAPALDAAPEVQAACLLNAMHRTGSALSPITSGNTYRAKIVFPDGKVELYGGSAGQAGHTAKEGIDARFCTRERIMLDTLHRLIASEDRLSKRLRELNVSGEARVCSMEVNIISFTVPEGKLLPYGGAHALMLWVEALLIRALWPLVGRLNATGVCLALGGAGSTSDADQVAAIEAGHEAAVAALVGLTEEQHVAALAVLVAARAAALEGVKAAADARKREGKEALAAARLAEALKAVAALPAGKRAAAVTAARAAHAAELLRVEALWPGRAEKTALVMDTFTKAAAALAARKLDEGEHAAELAALVAVRDAAQKKLWGSRVEKASKARLTAALAAADKCQSGNREEARAAAAEAHRVHQEKAAATARAILERMKAEGAAARHAARPAMVATHAAKRAADAAGRAAAAQ